MTETVYQDIPTGYYFEGDDALYQIIVNDKEYDIYRLSLQGERELVLALELEEGEKGISVDQEDGQLLVITYTDRFTATQILLYDIGSKTYEEIPFEPFRSRSSPDYQFIILS